MKNISIVIWVLLSLYSGNLFGQDINYTLSDDSLVNHYASIRRTYTTVRTSLRPRIDGILDDPCWQQDGVWAGDFIQQQPHQARPPSQKTEVKILYDDDNLYIAIKCHDTDPDGIISILGRRDDWTKCDITGVALDTYHDKQTAFEFNVTAAGQKVDLQHLGAFQWDTNWDAVWDGKAHIGDSMWTVEMRIPFSQLRFSDEKEQVWGMHIWRWITRLGEEDEWKLIPVDAPAMVYLFGELHGIKDIPKKRHFEIMPYGAVRYLSTNKGKNMLGFGIDGKAALSSNYTLDYTLFPDFGQVEADPSELNLTSYEVFYQEKRPFFLEGNAILDYNIGDDMLFYSRRIGHAPTLVPEISPGESFHSPSATDIINALKVTGKGKKGFSLGVINSMTRQEFAEVRDSTSSRKVAVEPFADYFIARAKQDMNNGNTVLGGMFTSTLRNLNTQQFKDLLPARSTTGGLDFLHHWKNRKYFLDVKSFFSDMKGSTSAITRLQQSPIHLYQRTDASYLTTDTTATELSGWGGNISGGKRSGAIRVIGTLSWRSPGLDLNDAGYLREADIISQQTQFTYFVNKPKKAIRNYTLTLQQQHDWDFGGDNIFDLLAFTGGVKFTNQWEVITNIAHAFNKLDTRQLRGGPALRIDPHTQAGFLLQTDASKPFSTGLGMDKLWSDNGTSRSIDYKFNIQVKFGARFTLQSNTYYEILTDNNQYVMIPGINATGRIYRKTLYTTLRAEYFVTPELSLQYYGSPYTSVGSFSKLYKVVDARAKDPANRYLALTPSGSDPDHLYYTDPVTAQIYTLSPPDFSFQEFRSNFVLRWEYKPGSTFYFVWSHNRSSYDNLYEPVISDSFENLGQAAGNNAITIKLSYWFSS